MAIAVKYFAKLGAGFNVANLSQINHLKYIYPAITSRSSSFRSSHPVYEPTEYPQVDIVKNSTNWKYVERLLPNVIVPQPLLKQEYPSKWQPQTVNPKDTPYFINRTKNYMLPIYLKRTFRGLRRITYVRKIQGDIWLLESDLKKEIEQKIGKKIITRVNEMSGQIQLKGDFVNIVRSYLMTKGL